MKSRGEVRQDRTDSDIKRSRSRYAETAKEISGQIRSALMVRSDFCLSPGYGPSATVIASSDGDILSTQSLQITGVKLPPNLLSDLALAYSYRRIPHISVEACGYLD